MIYRSVSIDQTIAKIMRDTRLQDSSYVRDFYEWIPEAMGLMQCSPELCPDTKDVRVQFHVARLPCGLVFLQAVEWCGHRVRHYQGDREAGFGTTPSSLTDALVLKPRIDYHESPAGNEVIDITPQIPVNRLPYHSHYKYYVTMDKIHFTGPDTTLKLHFKTTPVDSRGLPLIPDNPDYKEAIYWYVRAKMLQAGHSDPAYNIRDEPGLYRRFEQHAERAMDDITRQTPDQVEAGLYLYKCWIPPMDYFDSFFDADKAEPYYSDQGPIYS